MNNPKTLFYGKILFLLTNIKLFLKQKKEKLTKICLGSFVRLVFKL